MLKQLAELHDRRLAADEAVLAFVSWMSANRAKLSVQTMQANRRRVGLDVVLSSLTTRWA